MKIPHDRFCIVCNRRIRKRTVEVRVQPPSISHRVNWIEANITADLKTVGDCRRHTNAPYIISTRRQHGFITAFATWDGESYDDDYFCTNRCATMQGYAAAHHGHRFIWKD